MKKNLFIALTLVLSMFVYSCSDDKNEPQSPSPSTLNKNNLSLLTGETERLIYSGDNATWASSEPLIASVNSSGVVTANRIGTAIIRANITGCTVNVRPRYTMYKEPVRSWGCSQSEVANKMSGYELYQSSATQLTYKSTDKVFAYIYTFTNDKLTGSSMGIYLRNATNLVDFINERYVFTEEDTDALYLLSIDKKTSGAIFLSSNMATVVYLPVSESRSTQYNCLNEMNNLVGCF